MLARWFERSGIGQRLAPDPDAEPVSENDESRSQIWQILAPDENFAPPKAPPSGTFPPATGNQTQQDGKVICIHCHKWTDVGGAAPAMIETIPASPRAEVDSKSTGIAPQTPRTPVGMGDTVDDVDLNERVLSACRDTSMFMKSPKLERKSNDGFLRICSSTATLSKKLSEKLQSMVEKNNFRDAYLLRVRATKMGVSAPDGYTPLQVTAYANNIDAAKIILQLAKEYAEKTGDEKTYAELHLDRDLYGMTALHIAAERGNVDMIQLLLPLYEFPMSAGTTLLPAAKMSGLVDLGGQTAFGRAMTSPVPKAKKNQRKLEKKLFSKNDLSIFGNVKSNEERMGRIDSLGLHYGTADMPGLRGYMEDAMSVERWQQGAHAQSSSPQEMVLFTVCDGHGDNGRVSDFVASNVSAVLRECMEDYERQNRNLMVSSSEYWNAVWHNACLHLDRELKKAGLKEGGSTGVFALVTEQEIVVANVGDSRCILATKADEKLDTANGSEQEEDTSAEKVGNNNDDTRGDGNNEGDSANSQPSSDEPNLAEESSTRPAGIDDEILASSTKTNNDKTVVIPLSEDHKPNLPEEVTRIEKAGLKMKTIDIEEEDGNHSFIHKVAMGESNELAVSRAFGDFDYKANKTLGELEQAVIPIADVKVYTRVLAKDLYLVLACDGIWDVMQNHEVVDFVQEQVEIKSGTSPDSLLPDVADVLINECLRRESRDNMSAIVISLQADNNSRNSTNMPPKALDFGSPR